MLSAGLCLLGQGAPESCNAGYRCTAMSAWPSQCLRALRGNLTRPSVCAWGTYLAIRAVQRATIVVRGQRSASPEP